MFIEVNKFIDELKETFNPSSGNIESRTYTPKLMEDGGKVFSKSTSDELPHTLLGRHILSHGYGYDLALQFKRWLLNNYAIGNSSGVYDACSGK